MAVYEVNADVVGALITLENRDLNIMVCSDGTLSVTICKDSAGSVPLFKIPAGISAVTFCMREDICGPLYAISTAPFAITLNTWR
jgi:hypothetical protein